MAFIVVHTVDPDQDQIRSFYINKDHISGMFPLEKTQKLQTRLYIQSFDIPLDVQESIDEILEKMYHVDNVNALFDHVVSSLVREIEENPVNLYAYICYDEHRLPVYITLNEESARQWCIDNKLNIYSYLSMKVDFNYYKKHERD